VTLAPAILAWLRRAATTGDALALRGSVALAAYSPRARPAADVDHVSLADATLDAAAARARSILAVADPEPLALVSCEPMWTENPSPAVRLQLEHATGPLQVDLGINETVCAPPRPITIPGVGPLPAVAAEILFAWKAHGLIEFGHGRWRPKDLFDLDVLGALPLDPTLLARALPLAFSSRDSSFAALDDFFDRPSWGQSTSTQRGWRKFARTIPAIDPFDVIVARVRTRLLALVR
jgi:hypothetical protein